MEERNRHYQQLQLIGEEAPTTDWTDLTPSFEEPLSPALARTVDQLNQDYEELPPQNIEELSDLVEDLRNNPPTPVATEKAIEPVTEEIEEPSPVQPSTSTSCHPHGDSGRNTQGRLCCWRDVLLQFQPPPRASTQASHQCC